MERELKIAELATIWKVAVPTVWKRVREDQLKTVLKPDENNKKVNYVIISDEQIKKHLNTVNNTINNSHYEELLTVENDCERFDNVETPFNEYLSASEVFERLTDINNQYNERLEAINKELIDAKSKQLLLEDKANREGYYINEINTLKRDYKGLTTANEIKKYIIAGLVILLVGLITYLITVNNNISDQIINEKKAAEAQEVVGTPTPQQVKSAIMDKRK